MRNLVLSPIGEMYPNFLDTCPLVQLGVAEDLVYMVADGPQVDTVDGGERLLAYPDVLVLVADLELFVHDPRRGDVGEELRRGRLLRVCGLGGCGSLLSGHGGAGERMKDNAGMIPHGRARQARGREARG